MKKVKMEKTRNKEEVKNKEKVFNSADELIDYLFDLQKKGEYIFRGISNREQLYPTLIREFVNEIPRIPRKQKNILEIILCQVSK